MSAPNDITRYSFLPGPTRCGICGTVIVERRCPSCDAERGSPDAATE